MPEKSFGYESITVSTTVVTLNSTIYDVDNDEGVNAAKTANVHVENDKVRYNLDGRTPTAGDAMERTADSHFDIVGITDIKNVKFIKSNNAVDDPVIHINYRR